MNNDFSETRNQRRETRNCVEVAAGLVFRDGKLLITRRHAGAHLGGLWEFPGGKREAGEEFAACLTRELREELGIEVEVGEVVASVIHDYPEKSVHIEFFRCRWRRNEPRALGCADFRWIAAGQLGEYEFPPADAQLLALLGKDGGLWS